TRPVQRIHFRSRSPSRDPPPRIDGACTTDGSTRNRPEVGKDTAFPAKSVAEKTILIGAVWRVGIGHRRVCRARNHSCIVEELASGAVTRPMSRGATQGADVDESVSSVLGRHLKRQCQQNEQE